MHFCGSDAGTGEGGFLLAVFGGRMVCIIGNQIVLRYNELSAVAILSKRAIVYASSLSLSKGRNKQPHDGS
jgi:hypothetical protein